MNKKNTTNNVIRVWPATRSKLDRIRRANRWTISACVDALADAHLQHNTPQSAPARNEIRGQVYSRP